MLQAEWPPQRAAAVSETTSLVADGGGNDGDGGSDDFRGRSAAAHGVVCASLSFEY